MTRHQQASKSPQRLQVAMLQLGHLEIQLQPKRGSCRPADKGMEAEATKKKKRMTRTEMRMSRELDFPYNCFDAPGIQLTDFRVLKYSRLKGKLPEILAKDSASAVDVSPRVLVSS